MINLLINNLTNQLINFYHNGSFSLWPINKAQAIQAVEMPHAVNYPIKIEQTLIMAKVVKTEVLK